jgi:hypothetical protein
MSDGTGNGRAARAARNQALYREVNERVKEINDGFAGVVPPFGEWVCECANPECSEPIPMTHEEYEAIRAVPTHFLVKPDDAHVVPEAETVVGRHERYWIVEKIGVAAKLVERRDPRTPGATPPDIANPA